MLLTRLKSALRGLDAKGMIVISIVLTFFLVGVGSLCLNKEPANQEPLFTQGQLNDLHKR